MRLCVLDFLTLQLKQRVPGSQDSGDADVLGGTDPFLDCPIGAEP